MKGQDRPTGRREFLRRVGLLGMGLLGLAGLAARRAKADEVRCCTVTKEQLKGLSFEGDRCCCCCPEEKG